MKKGWRIIFGVVMAALLLGGLSIGVGFLTGADTARIIQNLDDQYHLTSYITAYTDYVKQLVSYFIGLF